MHPASSVTIQTVRSTLATHNNVLRFFVFLLNAFKIRTLGKVRVNRRYALTDVTLAFFGI